MDLTPEVVKSEKNEIELRFSRLDYGLFNAIKKELYSFKETTLAGFRVTHPEVGKVEFFLKTQGKDAKKVWNEAIEALSKKFSEFEKSVSKLK